MCVGINVQRPLICTRKVVKSGDKCPKMLYELQMVVREARRF